VAVPIAGDDPDAKRIVSELIEAVGFDAVDVGGLVEGRHLQPGSRVFGQALPAAEVRRRLWVGAQGR
jgi:predicted dinucleotide-binding enzyme